ncbi:MAG: DoxX family membrane protein [Steroidobacteraceae bacterium]
MSIGIALLPRLLLVLLFFPFSALDKVLNSKAAVGQASQTTATPWIAKLLVIAGFTTEVVMSTAILTGFADRLAALIMAAYCLLTALLWKQFWRSPEFRLKGPSAARSVFWDFLKNLSVAGGFLLLAIGANGSGFRELWTHPLGSTHPYEVSRHSELHP